MSGHQAGHGARHGHGQGHRESAGHGGGKHPVLVAYEGPDRRTSPRYPVDCVVTVAPLTGAARVMGHLVDLSMGGCRLVTDHVVMITIRMRVELLFELRGIPFRIVGVSQGTRGGKYYAIKFQEMTERKRGELRELLSELAEEHARKEAEARLEMPEVLPVAVNEAAAKPDVEVPVAAVVEAAVPVATVVAEPERVPEVLEAAVVEGAADVEAAKVSEGAAEVVVPEAKKAAGVAMEVKNLRAFNRHNIDTSAKLLLVNTGISMASRILDLSLGGCKLRTNDRFSVGIYVRVEAEFYLHGLPFRLGGVSQVILDRHTIGIRFLDMSERKREQLKELIVEIGEAEALRPSVDEAPAEAVAAG